MVPVFPPFSIWLNFLNVNDYKWLRKEKDANIDPLLDTKTCGLRLTLATADSKIVKVGLIELRAQHSSPVLSMF